MKIKVKSFLILSLVVLVSACDQRPDLTRLSQGVSHFTWREHEVSSFASATPEICNSIPAYETRWPIFNPDGFKVSYARSQCFLAVAEKQKDHKLCDEVKELKIPFLDGSKISKQTCLEKTAH